MKRSVLLFPLLLLLSACTERVVEVGFLNDKLSGRSDFTIDNATGGVLAVDSSATTVHMDISCDQSVEKIEVQNPQTSQWKSITELAANTTFDCAGSGTAQMDLPLDFVAPYTAPVVPGDITQSFQMRWFVKSLEAETYVFNKTLSVKFTAPTVSLLSSNINIALSANNAYVLTGSCSVSGGSVLVDGPFVGTPLSANCLNGQFSIVTTVDYSGSSGVTVAMTAKHFAAGSYRTYAEVGQSVNVDLIAPIVEITSPAPGTFFNAASFSLKSTVTVEGTCTEDLLNVKISANGVPLMEVPCSMAHTFSAEVAVAEGSSILQVNQTDLAGNEAVLHQVTVQKDTTGPGSFAIRGVRSMSGSDVDLDAYLRDSGLRVDLDSAVDAANYEFVVKSSDGSSVICPAQFMSIVSFVDFSSCTLAQNTSYRVYAHALDAAGNVTVSSNNGFIFTTDFPIPAVARVFALSPGSHHGLSSVVSFHVEYSRNVKVVGALPQVTLNTGAVVTASALLADKKTLQFDYVVNAGDYAPVLGVSSLSMTGCTGCLVDEANDVVEASLSLPTDAGPNGLMTSNVKVDAQAPMMVTLVNLGTVLPFYTQAPTVTFTAPTDPDPLTVQVQLIRTMDLSVLVPWSMVTSPFMFSSLTGSLLPGETYSFEFRAWDPMGNMSPISSFSFVSFQCPNEFVYVHNESLGASPFCVGQFEAKFDGSANPRFIANYAPESLTHMGATSRCIGMGPGYDLISNTEWSTIADLIAQQASNWNSASPGMGILHRGNNQGSPPSYADVGDPCIPNVGICASNALRRTHHLPYGQVLWDFAGNAIEIVKDTDYVIYSPNFVYPAQNMGNPLNIKYGTTTRSCSNPGSPDYCGFGKVDFINTALSVIWRGGASSDGNSAGVYAAKRATDVSTVLTNGGYRCVYHP